MDQWQTFFAIGAVMFGAFALAMRMRRRSPEAARGDRRFPLGWFALFAGLIFLALLLDLTGLLDFLECLVPMVGLGSFALSLSTALGGTAGPY
ncbi:MAG TPA: hypothetical protein VLL77_14155 [Anaerolineales bacterium]|nr:hypothetical protein [Anaerolineales bacterium]